jgi:undecaprenyl-diphosphatase
MQMLSAPLRVWLKKDLNPVTRMYLAWDGYIIIGTIPAAVIGLLFKDQIESAFSSILLVLFMLVITGTFLFLSQWLQQRDRPVDGWRSLLIGVAQAFAILPGISRSGSTIVTGMALGINRETAAKFSFILSIPAILGAGLIKTLDLLEGAGGGLPFILLMIGAISAFASGYLAILWLLRIVRKGKLESFAYYCYAVALLGFIWILFS